MIALPFKIAAAQASPVAVTMLDLIFSRSVSTGVSGESWSEPGLVMRDMLTRAG